MAQSHELTLLLDRWGAGNRGALEELIPAVYQELRRVARYQLVNERHGHTLDTAALVHEPFLRLGQYDQISWQDHALLAVASGIMRRVPVDQTRKRRAAKRSGSETAVTFIDSRSPGQPACVGVVGLDKALVYLESMDARLCEMVKLRSLGQP